MINEDILELIRQLSVKTEKPSILNLYLYYCSTDGEAHTQAEIQEATGLNPKIIKAGTQTLEGLELISKTAERTNRKRVDIDPFPAKFSLVVAMSLLLEYYRDIHYSKRRDNQTKLNENQFFLEDVLEDEDWKKIEPILLKYFKEHQVHPQLLVGKKQYFPRLMEVWEDFGEEEFDKYAEWYRVNKYPQVKFNYGMFLHFNVIGQYKDDIDDEDDRYMNTASMANRESFKKTIEESKKAIREIIQSD